MSLDLLFSSLLLFKSSRLLFTDLLPEDEGFGMLLEGVGIPLEGAFDGDFDFPPEEDEVFGIKVPIFELF